MSGVRRRTNPALPAIAITLGTSAVFLWRTLTWPAAASPDAWAYLAFGRSLIRLERLRYDLALTTPKPLGTVVGALAGVLPAERAFGVVAALALGLTAGLLFLAAERVGGVLAGGAAALAFVLGANVSGVLSFGLIDAVTAALIAASLAVTDGRIRIAVLVVAGLLRPEAWIVAGLAVYRWFDDQDELRRLGLAVLGVAAAPAIWLVWDAVFAGDALAILHETDRTAATNGHAAIAWGAATQAVTRVLSNAGNEVLIAVGAVGLFLVAVRRPNDWFPLAALLAWAAVLVVEFQRGLPSNPRYGLAMVALLAYGVGCLVPRIREDRIGDVAVPLVVTSAAVLVAGSLPWGTSAARYASFNADVRIARPMLEAAAQCGPLVVVGAPSDRALLPTLAVVTHQPLARFSLAPASEARPRLDRRKEVAQGFETPLGRLVVPDACAVS